MDLEAFFSDLSRSDGLPISLHTEPCPGTFYDSSPTLCCENAKPLFMSVHSQYLPGSPNPPIKLWEIS